MFNAASLAAVDAAGWRGPFIRPLNASYSFGNLPRAIQHVLTGEGDLGLPADCFGDLPHRHEAVIFLFVDGFGWRFFEPRITRYPALQRLAHNGVISKLTALFPSTTSAHVTCIHTGLPPSQSGVYEWFQYEPSLDRMIGTLMFDLAGEKERDTLLNAGLQPSDVFPARTIYRDLQRAGIKSYIFHSRDLAHSAVTRTLSDGATVISYKTLPEALVRLRDLLPRRTGPTYYFLYYSSIDTVSHEFGPQSDHLDAEIDQFLITLERTFLNVVRDPGALLMLSADHGQVEVNPKTTLYLNHAWREFKSHIARCQRANWLTPAGSPRDYFLHIKPESLDAAERSLSHLLTGKAIVIKTSDLIADGFFGSQPAPQFLARVGNLVVLPYAGESVYFYERDKFENRFFGHHGGPTREEMEIPLVVCSL